MASRRLTQLYDDTLSPVGLRVTQFAVLGVLSIKGDDAPTMRELAQSLVLDRSALSHALQPLLRENLVTLREDENDRRARRVILTSQGAKKAGDAWQLLQSAQDRFESVIGKSQADHLRATLQNIAHETRLASLND
jgi:DNA-binding MarR family transcriptional regulator